MPSIDHDPDTPLLTLDDLRPIAHWAADCAERALPLFEAKAPQDTRPRDAIAAARAFAGGGARTSQLRQLAWAAHAAAREAGDPAATAAARAASTAAASAYTHPIASPYQINHVLSPAAYAAQAIALSTGGTGEEDIRWAIAQASAAVRSVVGQLPARAPGKGAIGVFLHQLDAGLRA